MCLFWRSPTAWSPGSTPGDLIFNLAIAYSGTLEIGTRQLNNWRLHVPPDFLPICQPDDCQHAYTVAGCHVITPVHQGGTTNKNLFFLSFLVCHLMYVQHHLETRKCVSQSLQDPPKEGCTNHTESSSKKPQNTKQSPNPLHEASSFLTKYTEQTNNLPLSIQTKMQACYFTTTHILCCQDLSSRLGMPSKLYAMCIYQAYHHIQNCTYSCPANAIYKNKA